MSPILCSVTLSRLDIQQSQTLTIMLLLLVVLLQPSHNYNLFITASVIPLSQF